MGSITHTFTREEVDAFRYATKDTNPVHADYVLGFQLALVGLDYTDAQIHSEFPHYSCSNLSTSFRKPVPVGTVVTLISSLPSVNEQTISVPLELRVQDDIVASSTATYQLSQQAEHKRIPGHTYYLDHTMALQAAFGLGKTQPDYRALAIGIASHALLSDFAPLEERSTIVPVYMRHDLELHTFPTDETALRLFTKLPKGGTRRLRAEVIATAGKHLAYTGKFLIGKVARENLSHI